MNSVSDTLRSLPASLPAHESFPPHCGPIFDILSPFTADEVRKLLSLSLPKLGDLVCKKIGKSSAQMTIFVFSSCSVSIMAMQQFVE